MALKERVVVSSWREGLEGALTVRGKRGAVGSFVVQVAAERSPDNAANRNIVLDVVQGDWSSSHLVLYDKLYNHDPTLK